LKRNSVWLARMDTNGRSSDYFNANTPLLWKCAQGHVWKTRRGFVQQGGWCPACAIERRSSARRHDIHAIQALAENRGGMCISSEYVGSAEKVRWRWANGHEWEATPNQIQRGSWCPRCSPGYGARLCRCLLEVLFNAEFPKVKPRWLGTPRNTLLELDGYCERLKLAWEYKGQQHYEFVPFFAKRPNTSIMSDSRKAWEIRPTYVGGGILRALWKEPPRPKRDVHRRSPICLRCGCQNGCEPSFVLERTGNTQIFSQPPINLY